MALGEDEYELAPDRDAMIRGDFKLADLSSQIQAYLEGDETDMLNLDKGDMTITFTNPRAEKAGLQGLMNLSIQSAEGTSEKVRDLVQLRQKRGLLEIMRVNQEKTLLVMADLGGLSYGQAVEATREQMKTVHWPSGASWNMSGEEIKRHESFDKLRFALIIALVLVYMVIASILESVVHPMTIMISVPFALTGVVGAFLLTGISLNIMGYIGVVMLVGIVVNNAIVMLDAVHQLRADGLELREAVVLAGRHRLRPILMTSLTTILALFPLALGFGNGAELRRPMAIAVIGGLTSSTLLTLWIMPGIYLCVEDIMAVLRRAMAFLRGLMPGRAIVAVDPVAADPEDAS
jgi:HAE1 family hydrophobic/amphiphilic exporter-1